MGFFSGKKLLLLGFITILLAGIPLTIYLLQRQQEIRGRAAPATILSFEPATKKDVAPGTEFNLDIMLDPSNTNQVLSATIHIAYDKTKLATASPGFQQVVANLESQGLDRLAGKVEYEPLGNIIAVLNASDKTKVVKQKTKIATVTFKALAGVSGTTMVEFGDQSVATAFDPEDVNVLSSKPPATITFAGGVAPTISPSPTPTSGPKPPAQLPFCTSLDLDREASGSAPYSLTFTATGGVLTGTISKATFNFGDGAIEDAAKVDTVAPGSFKAQISHTYNNAGTYTAKVIFTDSSNSVSNPVSGCTKTITISLGKGGLITPTSAISPTTAVATPTPTTPIPSVSPGPGGKIMGIVGASVILSILGALLFFAL